MTTRTPASGPTPAADGHTHVTALSLRARKGTGPKIVALTAYDFAFARLIERTDVDIVLVGDSVGMVVQGLPHTLPVTLDEMVYHCRLVARGTRRAHLTADLPFMSYQTSLSDGLRAAGRLVKEGGAESVKVEGGEEVAELIHKLTRIGIPVMGHVGMTPQSVHAFGGFRVQGRTEEAADRILAGARAVAEAGAFTLVVESVPGALGARITTEVPVPTIGIGAGPSCDGQILVLHDVLGLDPDWKPKFARRFGDLGSAAMAAIAAYVEDVRAGKFPAPPETFT